MWVKAHNPELLWSGDRPLRQKRPLLSHSSRLHLSPVPNSFSDGLGASALNITSFLLFPILFFSSALLKEAYSWTGAKLSLVLWITTQVPGLQQPHWHWWHGETFIGDLKEPWYPQVRPGIIWVLALFFNDFEGKRPVNWNAVCLAQLVHVFNPHVGAQLKLFVRTWWFLVITGPRFTSSSIYGVSWLRHCPHKLMKKVLFRHSDVQCLRR